MANSTRKGKQEDEILYTPKAAYLTGAKAAVTFSKCTMFDEPENVIPITIKGKAQNAYRGAVPWGKENDLPNKIVEIVGKNPIGSRCLEFKINLSYGSGPKFGHINEDGELVEFTDEEIAKDEALKEIQKFFVDNAMDTFYNETITDMQWFYNAMYQVITDKQEPGKRKIVELSPVEATFSRWESANKQTGLVENHFYSTEWGKSMTQSNDCVKATPVIWAKNPITALKKAFEKKQKQYDYVLPIRMPSPGRKYYPRPYFYSIIESGWMDFANAIPKFKKALMTNQITVKYQIEIHEKYFPKIFAKEGLKTKEEMDKRVSEEYENINKYLKGVDSAGKTLITYYRIDHGTKTEISDIKIKVIDAKLGGEYIEDSQEASAMTYVAFGVHPSLIGVIPGKTNSNLSGSDKRELLRIEQSLLQRLRDQLLKPLYLVKAINKWPVEVQFWMPDLILTTLDQGKEVQEVNNG